MSRIRWRAFCAALLTGCTMAIAAPHAIAQNAIPPCTFPPPELDPNCPGYVGERVDEAAREVNRVAGPYVAQANEEAAYRTEDTQEYVALQTMDHDVVHAPTAGALVQFAGEDPDAERCQDPRKRVCDADLRPMAGAAAGTSHFDVLPAPLSIGTFSPTDLMRAGMDGDFNVLYGGLKRPLITFRLKGGAVCQTYVIGGAKFNNQGKTNGTVAKVTTLCTDPVIIVDVSIQFKARDDTNLPSQEISDPRPLRPTRLDIVVARTKSHRFVKRIRVCVNAIPARHAASFRSPYCGDAIPDKDPPLPPI